MMRPVLRSGWLRVSAAGGALLVLGATLAAPVAGHAPDPLMGASLWVQNQQVDYRWRSGQVPPDWMRTAINAAAEDSNASRNSRAAIFSYDAAGDSLISYGEPAACGVNGIACFNRGNAPVSFSMWFRRQGHSFDWGTLKWCEFYDVRPNGCFDAENVGLDEFGHVEVLAHHENYASGADYGDAVVQTYSRTKPSDFYNAHVYGRCDVATLQREYDVQHSSHLYSSCLDMNTTLSLGSSATSVPYRGTVTFTATLRVASLASYGRLGGNLVSDRRVTIQRRLPGSSTWSSVATMSPTTATAAGTYSYSISLTTRYEWRALFTTPAAEGINGDASGSVTVSVGSCTSPCPTDLETAP